MKYTQIETTYAVCSLWLCFWTFAILIRSDPASINFVDATNDVANRQRRIETLLTESLTHRLD